jgi:competence protein ComEC
LLYLTKKYPYLKMRLATLAFLFGILLCQMLPSIPEISWFLLLFPLFAFIFSPRYRFLSLFIFGVLWATWRADIILAQKLPSALEGQDIKITGTIINLPSHRQYKKYSSWQFDFAPLPFKDWFNPGILRLKWNGNPPQPLRPGQQWQLTVRLKRVHELLNPGVFDKSKWLFQNRILTTGTVRSKPRLLSEPSPFNIDNLRYRLAQAIRTELADMPSAGIIIGLAVGVRQWITSTQKIGLQRTGTAHLIAISGLHIGFVAMLTFWISRFLWRYAGKAALWLPAPYVAAFFSFSAAFLYALLAGFSISTQRALIMVAVALSGIVFARKMALSQILALAMLLVLLWDPLSVLSAGFWLSFGAVAIIAYALSNRHEPSVSSFRKWVGGTLTTQFAVVLGTLPIVLSIFGYVSLTSIPANLIAIPCVSFFVVPLTLLATSVILFFPELSSLLLHITAYIFDTLWVFLEWLAGFRIWQQHQPPLWTVLTAMVGVVILLLPRGFPARWLGIIWLLPLFFIPPPHPNRGEVWFTLLDIGQGLAAVVRTENHLLLYDTGTKKNGRAVILPFFSAKGIRHIDKLLISHDDSDHSGGARNVLENFAVDEILASAPEKFQGSNAHLCQAGQYWQWDSVHFKILHPHMNYQEKKDNDRSCVLKISSSYGTILLTGDIEKGAEHHLVGRYPIDLKADILVVPHHGSKTSSTNHFIKTVQPAIALFSAGYRSRYGHPKKEIVQRYSRHHIMTLNTAQTGAIQFQLSDEGISGILAREKMRRYWHQ